jgi:hypothetical protein
MLGRDNTELKHTVLPSNLYKSRFRKSEFLTPKSQVGCGSSFGGESCLLFVGLVLIIFVVIAVAFYYCYYY